MKSTFVYKVYGIDFVLNHVKIDTARFWTGKDELYTSYNVFSYRIKNENIREMYKQYYGNSMGLKREALEQALLLQHHNSRQFVGRHTRIKYGYESLKRFIDEMSMHEKMQLGIV